MSNKLKIFSLSVCVLAMLGFGFAEAEEKIGIKFFFSQTCPHCASERAFLEELAEKYPEVELKEYMISENMALVKDLYDEYDVLAEDQGFVPISFFAERYFLGFNEGTEKDIEQYVKALIEGGTVEPKDKNKIELPIIGEIDISEFSLPVLAVVFGVFDGFDLCSLSALVLILSIVLSFKSRPKILFFGSVFILMNALTYGLLIMFWLKVFSLLSGYIRHMEIIIGAVAFIGGVHFLRKFFEVKEKGPVCEMETGWGKGIMKKSSEKIKELFEGGRIISILLGLLIFDLVISVIEFPCSGALPVVFAGILSGANISSFQYYFYLSIFLFFYLLDEMIVFLTAVFTMRIWISSPKFVIWSNLAISLIMFLLGLYYLLGFTSVF